MMRDVEGIMVTRYGRGGVFCDTCVCTGCELFQDELCAYDGVPCDDCDGEYVRDCAAFSEEP